MAGFCGYCGRAIPEGAVFCPYCGKALPVIQSAPLQPPADQAIPPQQVLQTQPIRQPDAPASPVRPDPKPQPSVQIAPVPQQAQPARQPQPVQPVQQSGPAEIDCGEIDASVAEPAALSPIKIPAPLGGIGQGIRAHIRGIGRIFKKPAALIAAGILLVLWIVLAALEDSDSALVGLLSWLTFSEGGVDRGVLGTVGGMIGRGTVGASLILLFTGGMKHISRGFGSLFSSKNGEKRSAVSLIAGIAAGLLAYFFFTGEYASAGTSMAGFAGALFSLEALGGGGSLRDLAQSLTSRNVNGVRSVVRGRCEGLLAGLTFGFSLGAILSLLGIPEALL